MVIWSSLVQPMQVSQMALLSPLRVAFIHLHPFTMHTRAEKEEEALVTSNRLKVTWCLGVYECVDVMTYIVIQWVECLYPLIQWYLDGRVTTWSRGVSDHQTSEKAEAILLQPAAFVLFSRLHNSTTQWIIFDTRLLCLFFLPFLPPFSFFFFFSSSFCSSSSSCPLQVQ